MGLQWYQAHGFSIRALAEWPGPVVSLEGFLIYGVKLCMGIAN